MARWLFSFLFFFLSLSFIYKVSTGRTIIFQLREYTSYEFAQWIPCKGNLKLCLCSCIVLPLCFLYPTMNPSSQNFVEFTSLTFYKVWKLLFSLSFYVFMQIRRNHIALMNNWFGASRSWSFHCGMVDFELKHFKWFVMKIFVQIKHLK